MKPQASTWIVPWDRADATAEDFACFSELDPFAFALDEKGDPKLLHPELLAAAPRAPGRLVLPVIVNDVVDRRGKVTEKSPVVLARILDDGKRIERHVSAILAAVPLDSVDGVEIDYERVPPGAWGQYETFLRRLAQELHARGKKLAVDVEVSPLFKKDGGRGAFAELARHVDLIKVMAYYQRGEWADEVGPGNSASWVAETARRALAVVPADKLVIALSLSGTDWELPYPRVASLRKVSRLHYDKALWLVASEPGTLGWSDDEQAPYFDYETKGARHRLWYEDARSIAAKIAALRAAGVARVALWYAGRRHPDFNTSGLCRR